MPFKFGMLGMFHTHAHGLVRQIGEHPDEFSLVAAYDSDPALAADRQRKWAVSAPRLQVFDSAADVLKQDVDAIIVESAQHENLRMAALALESGRCVLLEKPAGEKREEHHRLIELARRKNLHVQMLYLFRYMTAVQEMLRRAARGEFGRIYAFRARLPKDLKSYQRYVEEFGRYAGGIFFEMAGHVIDMMVAMLGKPKKVTPFLAHHHTVQGSFIDNGLAVFSYDQAWGVIEVPALETAPHSRRIEVYGTEGACVIPHLGSGHLANKNIQPLELFRAGQSAWQRLELPAAPLQIRDLREFAAIVTGKKAPDFGMEHDLLVQDALLEASAM